jgi:iron transport multicopper oxidase
VSHFTVFDYGNLNNGDTDFGSGGVMLIPTVTGQAAPPMAVAMGKASILYLLSQNDLGGLRKNDAGALQSQYGGGGGLWGGPAYYDGPSGPTVFTQTGGDVLRAWSVNSGSSPSLTNTVSGTSSAGYGGSLPITSSNGSTANTGVVWLIDRANEPFSIEAYDATNLGSPIFSAQIGLWSNAGNGNPFLTAMEANGRVYGPGYKVVQVFGLTP